METIKEEKKADLEQLLNSLIEKGWKPTNRAKRGDIYKCEVRGLPGWRNVRFFIKGEEYGNYGMNLRELVSKDTGLWQFVCENGMIDVKDNRYDFFEYYKGIDEEGAFRDAQRYDESYEYRLIESSLKDESELENFLLNSIKLD